MLLNDKGFVGGFFGIASVVFLDGEGYSIEHTYNSINPPNRVLVSTNDWNHIRILYILKNTFTLISNHYIFTFSMDCFVKSHTILLIG